MLPGGWAVGARPSRWCKDSKLLRRALGDHAFESFLEKKRIEYSRFRAAVTDYELKTYLRCYS